MPEYSKIMELADAIWTFGIFMTKKKAAHFESDETSKTLTCKQSKKTVKRALFICELMTAPPA